MSSNKQISLAEIATGLLKAVPEFPAMARGVGRMATAGAERELSIGRILEQRAKKLPTHPALKFEDKTWSYASFNGWVNRVAALLQKSGVRSGDVVAILSENRPDMLVCTAAAVKLGAIAGMLNYNQRDEVLSHSLGLINPKVIVTGSECVDALETTEYAPSKSKSENISHFWMGDDNITCPAGFEDLQMASISLSSANPITTNKVKAKQPCFYVFTSGTTGMPKASVMTHQRWIKGGAGMGLLTARLNTEDVMYAPLPLYHNNALTVSWGSALLSGACFAITKKFSVSRFWDEVRQLEATAFCYIGELCRYLLNCEPSAQDSKHNIRVVIGNGLRAEIWMEFKNRFAINRICEFYGASECNLAFVNSFDVDCTAGYCPYPFAVVEYDPETEEAKTDSDGRLQRVASGGVGLLITKISKMAPFDGYTDTKASEKKILRDAFKAGDSWFNTGDLVRDQGYRHIQFVDRLGDTFRWKGENVATTEVEAAFKHVDSIEQAVVYGVQVPKTDGRAGMAAITLRDGAATFDVEALASTLLSCLPTYAVPVFIRLREEHEITGTFKNRKVELKNEGVNVNVISDPLYVFDCQKKTYIALGSDQYAQINSGLFRF